MTDTPFNPLDKKNLGISVANAMLAQPVVALGGLERFEGAGIYAIYYKGAFDTYAPLSARNQGEDPKAPIYVGKAVPAGARKGASETTTKGSTDLYRRLNKHASSITEAENLDLNDFYCRYLAVDDIWIPLGESLLIAKCTPVWNQCLDGFGNNDPGKRRYDQYRSKWDVLHPGRSWAGRCAERPESVEQIKAEVGVFLRSVVLP